MRVFSIPLTVRPFFFQKLDVGILNVHKDLNTCCAHKSDTHSDETALHKMLTWKN